MKDTCPTRDLLVQFVNATLTDTEADKIVAHLDSCESCCRAVDELERTQPALAALDQLRDVDGLNEIESPLPKKIGQYEIIEQIGQGGMGVVYRAVHPHLKREVALKVIRDSRLDDPTTRERFVQEMQSLGKLLHPNIVHATDAGIDGDTPFIVTELLDGHDLGTWLAANGKMPINQAVDCIRQAATGLAYAHEKGYVHRDIKPSNLFLTHDGVIKILDLGIARPLETSPGNGQTVTGHIVGSPEFMAPEQFHDGTVDARSDIYSLGQTFAYLLTGSRQSTDRESIPENLKSILARMTAGLPEQRFQCIDELNAAWEATTEWHLKIPIRQIFYGIMFFGAVLLFYFWNDLFPQSKAPTEGAFANEYFLEEGNSEMSEIVLRRYGSDREPPDMSQALQAVAKLHFYDMDHKGKSEEPERNLLSKNVIDELQKIDIGLRTGHPLDISSTKVKNQAALMYASVYRAEEVRKMYSEAKKKVDEEISDSEIKQYVHSADARFQEIANDTKKNTEGKTRWDILKVAVNAYIDTLADEKYTVEEIYAAKRKALEAGGNGADGSLVMRKTVQSLTNSFCDLDPDDPETRDYIKRAIYSDRLLNRDYLRFRIDDELRHSGLVLLPLRNESKEKPSDGMSESP